jgi:hypothetical protein
VVAALEKQLADLKAENEWVSVDNPPEEDGLYIALEVPDIHMLDFLEDRYIPADDEIYGALFKKGYGFYGSCCGEEYKHEGIKFWAYVLKPPKDES